MNIEDFLQMYTKEFIRIRRELHQCAELSTLEYETGALIRRYLEQWGVSYDYPVAETGIVAEIRYMKIPVTHAAPNIPALCMPAATTPIWLSPLAPPVFFRKTDMTLQDVSKFSFSLQKRPLEAPVVWCKRAVWNGPP